MATPKEIVADAIARYGRPMWVAVVPSRIVDQLTYEELEEMLAGARTTDKIGPSVIEEAVVVWAKAHTDRQISAYDLADELGVSSVTARKYLQSRGDLFEKTGRGEWTVKEVKA